MEQTTNLFLSTVTKRVELELHKQLNASTCIIKEYPPLHAAINYSVLSGGKRLRAALAYSGCHLFNHDYTHADLPACVVEIIHAYSLIHDDLPAMDNDDMRRGKPSCHKAFGEAQAILAGDALQTFAIQLLCESTDFCTSDLLKMSKTIAIANSYMVIGQAMDMQTINNAQELHIDTLEKIYAYKTAALINASLQLGAISSGIAINQQQEQALKNYAMAIGIAFQITDDILELDEIDSTDNKPNYVSIAGLEQAHSRVDQLSHNALAALSTFGTQAKILKDIIDYLNNRKH
jgi:geranylgeranyl pyrophosphate synthase